MNGFQILSSLLATLFCVIILLGLFRRKMTIGSAVFWLAVWIAAVSFILNPELTRIIAERLGITRGADLVFYFGILSMFVGFFLLYAKLRYLEQSMTKIARDLAIRDADGPTDSR